MIDKDLQDLAWRCLPREVCEEVKELYRHENKVLAPIDGVTTLNEIFGLHNLTSDAEGEEMLMCEKSRVQKIFAGQTEVQKSTPCGTILHHEAAAKAELLYALFGSKCLPEEPTIANNATVEEPKPSEPKYHVGDKIRIVKGGVLYSRIGEVTDIDFICSLVYYKTDRSYEWLKESDLEPYTEPACTDSPLTFTNDCQSQCKSQDHIVQGHEMFDNIIKDGFKNHNRLHIAAMIAAGWIAHDGIMNPDILAADSLTIADALIAESEKGVSK